jgi:hypothetical protein
MFGPKFAKHRAVLPLLNRMSNNVSENVLGHLRSLLAVTRSTLHSLPRISR